MSQPRDSQRQKVYNAEGVLKPHDTITLVTVEDMEAYIERLLRPAWFKRRWPKVAHRGIEVQDGRGRRRGFGTYRPWPNERGLVKMPVWTRQEWYLLHEVAHVCTVSIHGNTVAAHGWEFCSTYLELVGHQMGQEAARALQESFKAHRVRYRAPRARKALTEAQKAVLRERLAIAREAKRLAG